jgi:hypothetical protein
VFWSTSVFSRLASGGPSRRTIIPDLTARVQRRPPAAGRGQTGDDADRAIRFVVSFVLDRKFTMAISAAVGGLTDAAHTGSLAAVRLRLTAMLTDGVALCLPFPQGLLLVSCQRR